MPITQKTAIHEVSRYLNEKVSRLRRVVIRNLAYAGEECLKAARASNGYKDQTGNLRSSVGYIIIDHGRVVMTSDFAPSDKGTDRATGQAKGKAYAEELVPRFPSDIVLVVVAGMNYAIYVSAKGGDVIDSAELLAERLVPELMSKLKLTDNG